jgi:hypothetical protein
VTEPNGYFEAIFAAPMLENALLALIKEWLPTYLAEVERQFGIDAGTLARPKYFGTSVDDTLEPGERYPAIVVVSPGTAEVPEGTGGGAWSAWYDVTVATSVMGSNEMGARRQAGLYSAAVRALVMQHAGIGGVAEATLWQGEEFLGEPGKTRNRTRGGALTHFRIKVADVVNSQAGPTFPVPTDPLGTLPTPPTVETIDIDVHDEE